METRIIIELKHHCDNQATLLQMKCINELWFSERYAKYILFKKAFMVNGEIVTYNITKSEAEKLIDALKSGDRIKFNGYDEVVSDNKWYGEYYKKHEKRKHFCSGVCYTHCAGNYLCGKADQGY